jgi:hypothetical protein
MTREEIIAGYQDMTIESLQMASDLVYLAEKTDNTLSMYSGVERRAENRMSDEEFHRLNKMWIASQ